MANRAICGLRASPFATVLSLSKNRPLSKPGLFFHGLTAGVLFDRKWNSYTAVHKSSESKVNPPLSTLPVPLILPERPTTVTFSFLYQTGKAYLGFFKEGLRNVRMNYMLSREIMRTKVIGGRVEEAVEQGLLSRSEFQLLHRSMHDIKKVPIFALILIVFAEFTPFVIIAMSGVVPFTCRIPKQILSDRAKLEKRRGASFQTLPPTAAEASLEGLNRNQLLHISKSLCLHSSLWPDGIGLPPNAVLRRRIQKRVLYLEQDDYLIERDGGVRAMNLEEVRMALVERGVDILGKSEVQLRSLLRSWLWARSRSLITTLCLVRPSVWTI